MSNTISSMKFLEVKSNPGGIRSISFLTHKSNITAYPAIMESPVTPADKVTLVGDYTMAADAVFAEIYTRKGTGSVAFETAGQKDGKYFNVTANIDYPDVDDAPLAVAKDGINSDLILVVGTRVANTEKFKFVSLGSEMFACELSAAGGTGTLDDDSKKCEYTFEAKDTIAMKRYVGIIKTAEGTWDCSTGLFTAAV